MRESAFSDLREGTAPPLQAVRAPKVFRRMAQSWRGNKKTGDTRIVEPSETG